MPQSEVSQDDRTLLEPRVDWRPNGTSLLERRVGDERLPHLPVTSQVGVLRTQPELRRTVLGTHIDQAGVERYCEGVFGVLEPDIGVDVLSLVGR
jgi:hypothetical protein